MNFIYLSQEAPRTPHDGKFMERLSAHDASNFKVINIFY